MKKFLGLISLALICIIFIGCNGNNSAQVKLATQKLNSGLDKIISQTQKLEEINTSDIQLNNILENYYQDDTSYATNQVNNVNRNQTCIQIAKIFDILQL